MVSSPAQRSGVSVAEEEGAAIDDVSKMCLRDVYQWRRYERQTGRQMCIIIDCEEGEISSLPGYEMQKTPPPKSPPKGWPDARYPPLVRNVYRLSRERLQ